MRMLSKLLNGVILTLGLACSVNGVTLQELELKYKTNTLTVEEKWQRAFLRHYQRYVTYQSQNLKEFIWANSVIEMGKLCLQHGAGLEPSIYFFGEFLFVPGIPTFLHEALKTLADMDFSKEQQAEAKKLLQAFKFQAANKIENPFSTQRLDCFENPESFEEKEPETLFKEVFDEPMHVTLENNPFEENLSPKENIEKSEDKMDTDSNDPVIRPKKRNYRTENPAPKKKQKFLKKFRPFGEARDYVRSLGLKNQKDWYEYTKSKDFPKDIPKNPDKTYTGKGWIGLGDWLGTHRVANQKKKFRPFGEARDYVRSLGLLNREAWKNYTKRIAFQNKGWIDWIDWLEDFGNQFFLLIIRTMYIMSTKDWVV